MIENEAASPGIPKSPHITLGDRLEFGVVTINELIELSLQSRWKIYEDVKRGRLLIEKNGRSTRVRGPIAKLYIAGQPMPAGMPSAAA